MIKVAIISRLMQRGDDEIFVCSTRTANNIERSIAHCDFLFTCDSTEERLTNDVWKLVDRYATQGERAFIGVLVDGDDCVARKIHFILDALLGGIKGVRVYRDLLKPGRTIYEIEASEIVQGQLFVEALVRGKEN